MDRGVCRGRDDPRCPVAVARKPGLLRTYLGDYFLPILISGALCIIAAVLVRRIGRSQPISGRLTQAAT